ncbi:unnamed protein product [Caenorhabditis angaria]|uniref:Ionotropic glutamate receptor L-glutamate and glycine-binding domain-containing protein n=1 Tax=Caenorhabditis angaria TaxID=860376 RepID=A0A9P1IXT2_9PELO|nr:unnamed protein product [Caenorhabditis angaria]
MAKNNLRVVFSRSPPDAYDNCPHFPTLEPTFQCPFPGYTLEILKMLTDALKWNLIPIIDDSPVGNADWGTKLENGSWTGMLGYLMNGTSDTVCMTYQWTNTRSQDFDYSYPITNVQPIFGARIKNETVSSVLWSAFKPFSWTVWGTLFASLIFNIFVMIFISKIECMVSLREKFQPFEMVWNVVQLQLNEKSEKFMFYMFSGNVVLFLFALLQSGLMINLYKGLLLTSLLTSGDGTPFQDADEMIKLISEKKYHLTTDYFDWYFDDIKTSNASYFSKLRAAVKNNPVVNAESVENALDLVDTGSYVYPMQQDSLALQKSKERCDYFYITEGMPQVSAYLLFPKNSSYLSEINKQIIMNYNFIQRTFDKYFNSGYKLTDIPKCRLSNTDSSTLNPEESDGQTSTTTVARRPLDLESVIGVFMIGALGIAISFLVFFSEIYHYWHMRILERHIRLNNHLNVGHLKRDFRVVFARSPPDAYSDCPMFPTLEPSFNCPFPGYTLEILKMLADSLHWNLIPIVDQTPLGQANWGSKVNGTWTGMLTYLLNGSADTVCYTYQNTSVRDADFEYSYPITNVQPIFAARAKNETVVSVLWNAFKPFSWTVWGTLFASLIFNIFVMIFISKIECMVTLRKKFQPFEMIWHAIQLQLNEKAEHFYSSHCQNADEMIQLIAENKYHLTTDWLTWYFDDLEHSNVSHFAKLRAAMKDNPLVDAESVEAALDLVDTGRYVYPLQQDSLSFQLSKERCDYIYILSFRK